MMNLETFFNHFELLADAPNGVQKLRELILQLAVMGKLVPQDKNDEPASILLEKIKAEKAKLVKDKKIKKSKPLTPITDDEIPYNLPIGWEWVRLDDITLLITDGAHHTPTYTFSGVPFLSVKDISSGFINLANTRFISEETHQKLIKRCHPEFNDILLTKVGTTGIAKVIDIDIEFSIFVSLALLKFNKSLIYTYYLELLINSPLVKEKSAKNTQGVGNKNLVLKHIKNFVTPLPPLNEQHRIVKKVAQLMKYCDELENKKTEQKKQLILLGETATNKLIKTKEEDFKNNWQQIQENFELIYSTPENIKQLRQTILQLAVMGKLVPQDKSDEPASILLEKIKSEKAKLVKDKKIKKSKPLPPITDDEIPYNLPVGWEWVRLGNIVNFIGGSQPPKNKFIYHEEKGYTRLIQIRDFKSEEFKTFVPNQYANRPFSKDDVMIGRYGPPVFQILRGLEGTYNVALMKADPIHLLISKDYIYYLLQEPRIQKIVIAESERTAGQTGVRKELINAFVIGLPSLNEQHRIVKKVDQLMKYCDDLEQQLTQGIEYRKKLIQTAIYQLLAA